MRSNSRVLAVTITYPTSKADAKGVDLSELVNDLLRREIEIIEAVR